MNEDSYPPTVVLQRLMADGRISARSLSVLMGTSEEELTDFVTAAAGGNVSTGLSPDDSSRVLHLSHVLHEGFTGDITDDERLKGVLGTLTGQFRFTADDLGVLLRLERADVLNALEDPSRLPARERYSLAIRAYCLLLVISQVR